MSASRLRRLLPAVFLLALGPAASGAKTLSEFDVRVTNELRNRDPKEPSALNLASLAPALAAPRGGSAPGEVEDQRLRSRLRQAWPLWSTFGWWTGIAVTVWVTAMVLLLAVGVGLSRATMREVESLQTRPADGVEPRRITMLRRVYAGVITLAAAAYYLSLPLLIAVVVLLAGGVIRAFLMIGRAPVPLVFGLLVVVLVTVFSIVKSLAVIGRREDPGLRADLRDHPRLKAVLDSVADEIGTRPVDTVFLLPGTEFGVMERGSVMTRLRGRAERCLLIGVGLLDGFRVGSFRAILAHEYGHFVNRDTSSGRFALSVRRSMSRMAQGLAASGAKMALSPAWWFLAAFGRLFHRVSQGASRLQEVLADRWAVAAYGVSAFSDGLRHVVERTVRFEVHAQLTALDMQTTHKPVVNLYVHKPRHRLNETDVQRAIDEAFSREPSVYDSHPSPAQRLEWATRIGGPAHPLEEEPEDAWQLFEQRREIELEMTGRAFV